MFTAAAPFVSFAVACLHLAGPADFTGMVARKLNMHDSYHLRLRFESRRSAPDTPTRWDYTAELWRAGDKFRIDLFDAESNPPPPAGLNQPSHGFRHVTCQNCERPGHLLITTVYPGKPAITSMAGFHTSADMSPNYTTLNIDWRFFGLCNTGLDAYRRIPITKCYQELAADPGLRMSRRVRGGKPCLVASLGREKEHDIWFDEADGFNPVLHSAAYDNNRGSVGHTTEVAWRATAGGHLYPSRLKYVLAERGAVRYEEVVTVVHADFHNPVDPSVFTLGGLGLNDNQKIAFPELTLDDQPLWRDGKADPSLSARAARRAAAEARPAVGSGRPAAPVAPYLDGGSTSLVLSIASGALALVLLGAALAYRRRGGA